MRSRLTRADRRADILAKAQALFAAKGITATEMEDIRQACGISRGGLYHHFANKRAILEALVEAEVTQLAQVLIDSDAMPITALLSAGSAHLGAPTGIAAHLQTKTEKHDYLSALDQAFDTGLCEKLAARLEGHLRADFKPLHVAALFLTVNSHINRQQILGYWTAAMAADFAATALMALQPFLLDTSTLAPLIDDLRNKGRA